jgi:glycosyltransferase involved in cell wall biosynthesis
MKKILHIINELGLGGTETALYRLVQTMQSPNYSFHVIVLSQPGFYSESINQLGVPIHYLNMNKKNIVIKIYTLIKLIKHIQPDIVQTWLYHSDFIGGLCAKLCGVEKIIWGIRCEGLHLKFTTNWIKRFCALLSGVIPDVIITNSASAFQHHSEIGYRSQKMTMIPNGFETDIFAPNSKPSAVAADLPPFELRSHTPCGVSKLNPIRLRDGATRLLSPNGGSNTIALPDNAILIGTLARFHPDKDYPTLIQAIDRVCSQHDNVYFSFCGHDCHDKNPSLMTMLNAMTHRNRVMLLNQTDQPATYLNQLDIFILSSKTEGFPNSLAEAMACELPCIATNVGEVQTLLQDSGITVPRQNSELLAQACLDMLQKSPLERAHYGKTARQRIEKHYSMAHYKKRMTALYESTKDHPLLCAD